MAGMDSGTGGSDGPHLPFCTDSHTKCTPTFIPEKFKMQSKPCDKFVTLDGPTRQEIE